jgi:hypothetical protein
VLDTKMIDRWLSAYLKAWWSDSPNDIAELFEPDARYFTEPFRDPHVGREAIVEWWVGNGDSAVSWTFDHEVLAAEGPLFVVKGVTTYPHGGDGVGESEVYDNIWLVTLEDSGRASEFVEYWMQRT